MNSESENKIKELSEELNKEKNEKSGKDQELMEIKKKIGRK